MNGRQFSWEAFFSYGFRPFFLFACIFAALSMSAWMLWIGLHAASAQVLRPTIAMAPHAWHAHEMLFGYTMAVIAGFFLTAVPNWTGAKPVNGGALVLLSAAWLAGRAAVWMSAHLPMALVAAVDLAFIPMLLALVAKALLRRWAPRNFVFIPILTLLLIANALVHAEWLEWIDGGTEIAYGLALNTVVVLIAIVGGRVVPAFTTNALRRMAHDRLPASHKSLEIAAIVSVVAVLIAELAGWDGSIAGTIAGLAALVHAFRLAGWQGHKTLTEPIVWVLHLGYGWLVVGLGLKAAAHFGLLGHASAIHALTVGAVGTMTLAIMTRASLGHTGRALQVNGTTAVAYVMVSLSAVLRIAVPVLIPEVYNEGMIVAGLLWVAAFAAVSVAYWPVLTMPRISSRAAADD